MKKVLITILIVLICLTPMVLLVIGAIQTATPKIYLNSIELTPAFEEWKFINSKSEEVLTKKSEERLQKSFEKNEPVALASFLELQNLTFEIQPNKFKVVVFDLNNQNSIVGTYNEQELLSITQEPFTKGKYQVVLTMQFELSNQVSYVSAYSFEVTIV